MFRRANTDEETTDRRAVCGRTARTVRREGKPFPALIWVGFARKREEFFTMESRESMEGGERGFYIFRNEKYKRFSNSQGL